jgi:tripartite-type tricarboxylate transporter receptor subunit TctC
VIRKFTIRKFTIRKFTIRLKPAMVAAVAVAALAVAMPAARAETPAEFYKGKTINLYVGVSAGGIYSTFALLLAQHMEKHVPGHPNIIVQHMPGAGGTRAVDYVYEVAPKDGTAVLTPNAGVALRVLLGIDNTNYDPAKFTWLGGSGEAVNTISLLKDNTPVRTLDDAKQLASEPAADLPNVPLLSAFATNGEQRQMFTAVQSGIADRAIVVPPGVPADRVAALRTAYEQTLRDPAFVKDATARDFEIDPISGDRIQKFVSDLMATPKPVVARMKEAMGLK